MPTVNLQNNYTINGGCHIFKGKQSIAIHWWLMLMFLEKRLIIRFNRGDASALRDIYGLYKDELVSLAAILLRDKIAAEDVVHDVFAGLVQKQTVLKIARNLRGYLFTAVTNRVRQHIRKVTKQRQPSSDVNDEGCNSDGTQPECWLVLDEQKRGLAEALAKLPYEQREVVLLRHYSDFRFKQIAITQKVSVNTVQGRYRYGIDKLRTLLNGERV
jgi:RNA polymerase sigma factor (sigma-70 family)